MTTLDKGTYMNDSEDTIENVSLSLRISVYSIRYETPSHSSHTFRVLFLGTMKRSQKDCKKTIWTNIIKIAKIQQEPVSKEGWPESS